MPEILDHERAADVAELLHDARLVTITGMAGVGKTRLAREVARSAGLRRSGWT